MGTNYYLHTNVCPHCKRAENRIHVGKSSVGWPFLFRGYREKNWLPDGLAHPITGAFEWDEFLKSEIEKGGALIDEYGKRHELADFWQLVRNKQGDTRGEAEWRRGSHRPDENEWRDINGYRFCSSEFS